MAENKFYLLYNNKNQDKLLTTAASLDKLLEESQYYTTGVWFEYDTKENSNLIFNEKMMVKGVSFPEVAKDRIKNDDNFAVPSTTKAGFKWVS